MMRAELYTASGEQLLAHVEVPTGPVCGADSCEVCEDCMSCFPCAHARVVYVDQLDEFLDEHDNVAVRWIGGGLR